MVGGEGREREQVFTQADQEYSAYIEDESGRRRLLMNKLRWLCFISQWLYPADLWTLRLSNKTRDRQLQNHSKTKAG